MKEKIKIEIKNSYNGDVLFSFESFDNTIKKTVLEAIRQDANLRSANLRSADLSYADLSSADLRSADLSYADLSSADLRSADLRYANLRSADLRSADLSSADLRSANLSSADLRSADLRSANLRYADLSYANLSSADLRSADLRYADLSSANIKKIRHLYQIIPEEGTFIAWKKASGYILKLEVHSSAKRTCNIKNRKCRCSKVKTLEIQNIDGTISDVKECVGDHDNKTMYRINKVTRADKFDNNFLEDCTNGIHFFITRQEAVNW